MGAILLVSGLFYFRSKLLRSACFSSFSVFFFLFSQSILLVPLLFDPKFAFFLRFAAVWLPFFFVSGGLWGLGCHYRVYGRIYRSGRRAGRRKEGKKILGWEKGRREEWKRRVFVASGI